MTMLKDEDFLRQQDAAARQTAIDPQHSFIVQAPAGSGKTELLTQRLLALLAIVQAPEHILAITFTKKAAAEMRERVFKALTQANTKLTGKASALAADAPLHERTTFNLARAVLERNSAEQWGLLEQPNRLPISTIDALNLRLARQMPYLTRLGSTPNAGEDNLALYQRAAERTLQGFFRDATQAKKLQALVERLNYRYDQLVDLLAEQLGRREQWLWLIQLVQTDLSATDLRQIFEPYMQSIVQKGLQSLLVYFPAELQIRLQGLAQFAQQTLRAAGKKEIGFQAFAQASLPLDASAKQLVYWQGLSNLLCTKEHTWRKSITVALGFPAKTPEKEALSCIITQLAENAELLPLLQNLHTLPTPSYSDDDWQILALLMMELLPSALQDLERTFAQEGQLDFTEVQLRAASALGQDENPTDLALQLDYQIQHILLDEFQDTSRPQIELLEKLTAGWQPEDGRSLFLVGDPMQSIYSFRGGEVALFKEVQENGIGDVRLRGLVLACNFRSDANIVNWVNTHFPSLFTQSATMDNGIEFKPSIAKNTLISQGVNLQAFDTAEDEARYVSQSIQTILQNTDLNIGILASGRVHFVPLIMALRQAKIEFQAIKLDTLHDRAYIHDLVALTKALLHPADKLNWLAVLRAPFCGLTWADLLAFCKEGMNTTIPDLLAQEDWQDCSEEAKQRLRSVQAALLSAYWQRERLPLSLIVEHTWRKIQGVACLPHASAIADCNAYFKLLQKLGAHFDAEQLDKELSKLYASPNPSQNAARVQLMTIHQSKGLQFGAVFIIQVNKSGANDKIPLLNLQKTHDKHLLIAPISGKDNTYQVTASSKAIHAYINSYKKAQQQAERCRLLYVAATRAEQQLSITGTRLKEQGSKKQSTPKDRSLLSILWSLDTIQQVFQPLAQQNTTHSSVAVVAPSVFLPKLFRLARTQLNPAEKIQTPLPSQKAVFLQLQDQNASVVGTVAHLLLAKLASRAEASIPTADCIQALLLHYGYRENTEYPIRSIATALHDKLHAIAASASGKWLLNPQHQDSACELSLSILQEHKLTTHILDRTFIDAEGTRWIIDYKTLSIPTNVPPSQFYADKIAEYRPQLLRYAGVLKAMEDRPQKLALYFVWQQKLFEIE